MFQLENEKGRASVRTLLCAVDPGVNIAAKYKLCGKSKIMLSWHINMLRQNISYNSFIGYELS